MTFSTCNLFVFFCLAMTSISTLFAALKSHGKSATFRQHYYPEGGWGWVITFCCLVVNILTTGLQLSYGVLVPELVKHCQEFATPERGAGGVSSKKSEIVSQVDAGKHFLLYYSTLLLYLHHSSQAF